MSGKPAATVTSMHVCPMVTPGSPPVPHVGGPVSGPGSPGVMIDGKPAALVGDMCTCVGPPDSIIMGAPGVMVDGKPLATVGSTTAHGGQITVGSPGVFVGSPSGGGASSSIDSIGSNEIYTIDTTETAAPVQEKYCANNPQLRDYRSTEKVEESKVVELESTFALDAIRQYAEEWASSTFYLFLKTFFHGGIPIKAYKKLYDALSNGESLNPPIKVVKKGLSGDASFIIETEVNEETGEETVTNHEIRIQERWALQAIEGIKNSEGDRKEQSIAKAKSMLLEGLLEEYGHYLDYMLRYEYSDVRDDSPGDEGALIKEYFLMQFNPLEDTALSFGTAKIDGAPTELVLDFSEFQKATQNVEADLKNANEEFFSAGEGNLLMEQYGHLGIEDILRTSGILNEIELSHLYLGNYMRDMSQVVTPLLLTLDENERRQLRDVNKDFCDEKPTWLNNLGLSRKALTSIVELLAAGQMRKITENKKTTKGVSGPGSKLTSPDEAAEGNSITAAVRDAVENALIKVGIKAIQAPLDYVLFIKHYGSFGPEELGVYRPEEHMDNPLYAGVYDSKEKNNDKEKQGNETPDIYFCAPDLKPELNEEFGMKNHIRNYDQMRPMEKNYDEIGSSNATGIYSNDNNCYSKENKTAAHLPTAASYMETQFEAFYDAYTDASKAKTPKEIKTKQNNALRLLGNGLHVLEDFFAHTNFCELSLIKNGISVYPWIDLQDPQLTKFKKHGADPKEEGKYFKVKNTVATQKPIQEDMVHKDFLDADQLKSFFEKRGSFEPLGGINMEGPLSNFYFLHLPKTKKDKDKDQEFYLATLKESTIGWSVKPALEGSLAYEGSSYASSIPLVSGYFSQLDTVHSLIHVLEDVFKPVDVTVKSFLKGGDGPDKWTQAAIDVSDIIILFVLNDLQQTQQEQGKTTKETGKSLDASTLLKWFKKYIEYRGIILNIVMEFKKGNPWAVFLGAIITRFINTIYTMISNGIKTIITECLELLAGSLTAYQNMELDRPIGTDPSHSQLAKDSHEHPLHSLAADCAREAVKRVGGVLFALKEKIPFQGETVLAKHFIEVAKSCMVHPAQSDWMDETVRAWVKSHGGKLAELHEVEQKRQKMSALGVHIKATVKSLEAKYKELQQQVTALRHYMIQKFEEIKAYVEDLKKLAIGLTEEVSKKYQEIMKSLDQEFEAFKKRIQEIAKDVDEFTDDQIQKIQEHYRQFDKQIEQHLDKAYELLKEASEEAPKLLESVEEQLKEYYKNLKGELPDWLAANPKNMFKHQVLAYLEEFEPEQADQYKAYANLQQREEELTKDYVSRSSQQILAQLDMNQNNQDTTRLA